MIAVRYSGFTNAIRYRNTSKAECEKPRRWLIRAQLLCLDAVGAPARVSGVATTPKAMRLGDLKLFVKELLLGLGTEDAGGMLFVAATWLAISESPRGRGHSSQ